jgi:hypothetical protein
LGSINSPDQKLNHASRPPPWILDSKKRGEVFVLCGLVSPKIGIKPLLPQIYSRRGRRFLDNELAPWADGECFVREQCHDGILKRWKGKQTPCLRSMLAFAISLASVMPVHVQVLANGQPNPTDELKIETP